MKRSQNLMNNMFGVVASAGPFNIFYAPHLLLFKNIKLEVNIYRRMYSFLIHMTVITAN